MANAMGVATVAGNVGGSLGAAAGVTAAAAGLATSVCAIVAVGGADGIGFGGGTGCDAAPTSTT